MNNRHFSTSVWLVCLIMIFYLALAGLLFGKGDVVAPHSRAGFEMGNNLAAQVIHLWPIDGAVPGAKVRLLAQVRNIGSTSLSSDARVWFWVDNAPNWSANHWVGSASAADLAPGTDRWYSYDWTVPANSPEGNYSYWAQLWTSTAISDWSSEQQFAVAKIPNMVGEWQGRIVAYGVANSLVKDPTDALGKLQYFEDESEEMTIRIIEQTGRVFASWDSEGRKATGVLLPDGTVRLQAFEPTEFRGFISCTLRTIGGRLEMTGYYHWFDDFGLSKPDPTNAGHFNMGSGYVRFIKVK